MLTKNPKNKIDRIRANFFVKSQKLAQEELVLIDLYFVTIEQLQKEIYKRSDANPDSPLFAMSDAEYEEYCDTRLKQKVESINEQIIYRKKYIKKLKQEIEKEAQKINNL